MPSVVEPSVVFVLGAPRSGTSLVYRTLCLHPEMAWISNWVRRLPGVPRLAVLNRIATRSPGLRRKAWFVDGSNAYVYGARRPLWHRLYPSPVEGEPVFARCGVGPGPAVPTPAVVAALRRSFRAVQRAAGGACMVNKRVANNLRVPLLAAAFPEGRFVHVVRDGRAVAQSLSRVEWWPDARLWWLGRTPAEWEADGGDPWELCARTWVEEVAAVRRGLADVDPTRVLEVRYETLVERPLETLRGIVDFAGLEPVGPWEAEVRSLRFPNRNEVWRRLPPDVVATIERVQGRLLRELGYC